MSEREPSPVEIVELLVERTNAGEVDRVIELLSEEWIGEMSTGQVYTGHNGYIDIVAEHLAPFEELESVTTDIREAGGGYVIHEATVIRKRPGEEREAVPGIWLHRIENGKIRATVYYRTLDQALAALPEDR